MSDSKSLDDLDPKVQPLARRLLSNAEGAGIPLAAVFTLRSMETQAKLYAQGRTAPGKKVTNAKPGDSFHNYGLALDVVPKSLLNRPNWAPDSPLWPKVGEIGKQIGFRWGGDFTNLPDRPHFEWSGSLSLTDLKAGKRP